MDSGLKILRQRARSLCEEDKILGPYSSRDKLLFQITNNGELLGMSKDEFVRFVNSDKYKGKSFYLYPLSHAIVSDILWNDSPVAN